MAKTRIPPNTDEEEALIQAQIAADPDDAEATDQQLAEARPFADAFPELAASMRRARGRPALERPKKLLTLRLDQDVIDKFKATGDGWQRRMNDVLRAATPGR